VFKSFDKIICVLNISAFVTGTWGSLFTVSVTDCSMFSFISGGDSPASCAQKCLDRYYAGNGYVVVLNVIVNLCCCSVSKFVNHVLVVGEYI
jgi:Mg2+/Co2+ transporter CorB